MKLWQTSSTVRSRNIGGHEELRGWLWLKLGKTTSTVRSRNVGNVGGHEGELRVWLLLKLGILLELRVSTWKTGLHRVLIARLGLPLPPLRHFKAKKEGKAKMMLSRQERL